MNAKNLFMFLINHNFTHDKAYDEVMAHLKFKDKFGDI